MKIGILSDTHNTLREEVIQRLEGCELILHAGDVCKREVLSQLEGIAPTICVRGNNDKEEWAEELPKVWYGELGGIKCCMVHDKKDIPKDLAEVELVIYGHSHKFSDETKDEIRYLNPGSCGRRRFSLPLSMVIGTIEDGNIHLQTVEIVG